MNIKNLIKRFGVVVVLVVLLYTSYNGIMEFYIGYHNLDLAYNFIQLGYNQDLTTSGEFRQLHDLYIQGRNQIKNGFNWLVFDVILALLLGYLIKRGGQGENN